MHQLDQVVGIDNLHGCVGGKTFPDSPRLNDPLVKCKIAGRG